MRASILILIGCLSAAWGQTRSAAGGLEPVFREMLAAQTSPAWIAYTVPGVATHMCDSCCCTETGTAHLEGSPELNVLFRVERKQVTKIRAISGDCRLDAGGLPIYRLTDVRPAQSIALLSEFAEKIDSAVTAIALHADPAADAAVAGFAAPGKPEKLRETAVFWLGAARGKGGAEVLKRIVREDASGRIREKAVFALSVSKEPDAVDAIIAAAKGDASARVRGQALFWLAQKAGSKAAGAITEAIENDPETAVKRQAVFALSRLPGSEGVPLLIQVARNNANPAVRKQAMFWLGQSRDPRALDFFEQVLKR
jgi:HEAT repeat protein